MNQLLHQLRTSLPMMDDETRIVFAETSFPALEVTGSDDAIDISGENSGVNEDNLDVSVCGNTLIFKGGKRDKHGKKEERVHLIERRFDRFRRRSPLSFSPEKSVVDAAFSDGIQTMHITEPATAKAAVQQIIIQKTRDRTGSSCALPTAA